jgi:hypothetical protein
MTEGRRRASGEDVRQGEPVRREAGQPALHRSIAAWSLLHELGEETPWERRFEDPSREWRRLFSELFGTFLLVLAGAGAPVVNAFSHGAIGRGAAVTAPGLAGGLIAVGIAFILRGPGGDRQSAAAAQGTLDQQATR